MDMNKSILLALMPILLGCYQGMKHDRPRNIHHESFYLGGIDGGVWIDTVHKDLKITCYIYSEYGEVLDTCFISGKNKKELNDKVGRLASYHFENCFEYYDVSE